MFPVDNIDDNICGWHVKYVYNQSHEKDLCVCVYIGNNYNWVTLYFTFHVKTYM